MNQLENKLSSREVAMPMLGNFGWSNFKGYLMSFRR